MLGISFGTSTISCAFTGEGNEQPKIVGQPESSCIFFNRNKEAIFVGKRAEMWKLSSKGQAIYDFKRLIGQTYSYESVDDWQKAVTNVPIRQIFGGKPVFEIVQNGENKIKGTEQIVAQILTKIRQQAEKFLYDDLVRMFQPILLIEDVHLQNVVLTVPASFKMAQKHAIEESAAIAGFEQIQLMGESFAAGLGFVHENPRFSGILLVLNFGAGFLDISILNVIDDCKLANFMENKRIEILGMAGDGQLGGLDIDAKIAEHFALKIGQRFPDMDLMGNTKLMHKLRMECKKLKEKIFTFNEDVCLEMDELHLREEELTMTIQELEEICAPICEKAIQILMRLLKNTEMDGLRLHNISKVLLTGGTSRIPQIKRLLMENGFAEQKLCTNFDMGIAAKGAAIFGSKLGKMLSSYCGQLFHGLDILLPMHSKFIVLFPPGTSFPTGFTTSSTVPISCQTSEDGQSCIRLEFYECDEFVASVTVDGLPPESKAGTVKVDLEIGLTRNGLLHVECLQISYPTNSSAFRVRQRMKRVLPLEFGHFHGCKLPSSSNDEINEKLIYDEEMKENIPPQNPKMEDTERECPICFNEFDRNEHRIFCEPIHRDEYPQKRHSICAQCIIQNAKIKLQDRALAHGGSGLPCMITKCKNVLTLAQMRQILPEDILERFEEFSIEYSIENVDKLERCSNFRMILEGNLAEMRVFRCPECNYELCRKCKFPWNKEEHFGRSCEQLEEAERERIRLEEERIRLEEERRSHEERMEKLRRETQLRLSEAMVRKCVRPTCGYQFVKLDGCNRIVCSCNTSYCYICNARDVEYNHFCRCQHPPATERIPLNFMCQICGKTCILYENAELRDDQKMENIRKEAKVNV